MCPLRLDPLCCLTQLSFYARIGMLYTARDVHTTFARSTHPSTSFATFELTAALAHSYHGHWMLCTTRDVATFDVSLFVHDVIMVTLTLPLHVDVELLVTLTRSTRLWPAPRCPCSHAAARPCRTDPRTRVCVTRILLPRSWPCCELLSTYDVWPYVHPPPCTLGNR
jgi:hypothetical protein